MNIHGMGQVHGPQGINQPHHPRLTQAGNSAGQANGIGDQLEISPAAQAAIDAASSGAIRHDVVARIRGEIAAGTYETADKLDQAIDRLLDEIG